MKKETNIPAKDDMRAEYDFRGGVRGKYRDRIRPGDTDLKNCKVKVTLWLDADILEYFNQRAAQPDAAPSQTQINMVLRQAIEHEQSPLSHNYTALLTDEGFIAAVAARVKELELQK